MKQKKSKTGYQTDIDNFLAEFNAKRTQESVGRQKEIEKNQRIALRRDHPVEDPHSDLWESF